MNKPGVSEGGGRDRAVRPERPKKRAGEPLGLQPEKFVAAYVSHGNAARAAREAGYGSKQAHSTGHKLLQKPEVAAAVAALRAELSQRLKVDAERILAEYVRIAFADLRSIFDAEGRLLHPTRMDDDTAACIGKVEIVQHPDGTAVYRIKRIDKKGALDSLARALGLFRDPLRGGRAENLVARLDAARKRVGA